jgi:cytoskeletal protein CcmA (bactofilin family)
MWKKEDSKPQGVPEISTTPASSTGSSSVTPSTSHSTTAPLPVSPRAAACISQGIKIKGEVTGSEDLFVDGQLDGKLNLANGSLTIGPNGSVKADVNAREVVVRGKIEGKVTGRDRIQLWSTSQVTGEMQTDRLAIEEGAVFRGKVEAGKPPVKALETKTTPASVPGKSSDAMSLGSGSGAD